MAFGGLKNTFKNSATSIGTSIAASGAQAVRLGDLIFVLGGEQTTPTIASCADNLSNVYTSCDNTVNDAGTSTGRAFWARVKDDGTLTTVTITANGGTSNGVIVVAIIEGPITNAIDKNPANITSDITSPFDCPTTGTLGQANEIVMGWLVGTGSTVNTATSPNLLADQQATASVLHGTVGYQAVTATTAVIPVFAAGSNPTDQLMGTATFRRDDTPLGAGNQLGMKRWPNPVGLAPIPSLYNWADRGSLALLVGNPFYKIDWINPAATQRPIKLTWTNLGIQGDAIDTTNLPSVVSSWPAPTGFATKDGTWINLGIKEVVTDPFFKTDWPNPRGQQGTSSYVYTKAIEVDTTVYLPSTASGWPIPPTVPQTLSYTASFNLSLPIEGPFKQTDWPSPKGLAPTKGWVYSQPPTAEAEPAFMPSVASGWPIPLAPRRPQLSFFSGLPPVQFVTRAPLIAKRVYQSWHVALQPQFVNRLPITPVPPAPFNKDDWPNPGALPPTTSFARARNLPLNAPPAPFSKTDWTVPKAAPPTATFTSPLDLALNTVVDTPFSKTDWTNPKTLQQALSFANSLSLPLNTVTAVPFTPLAWPLPKSADRQSPAFFQSTGLPLKSIPFPFNKLDWTNPKSFASLTEPNPRQNFLPLATYVNVKPFNKGDWPNPRRESSSVQFSLPMNLPIVVPPPPAPDTFEWLQRARRRGRR